MNGLRALPLIKYMQYLFLEHRSFSFGTACLIVCLHVFEYFIEILCFRSFFISRSDTLLDFLCQA